MKGLTMVCVLLPLFFGKPLLSLEVASLTCNGTANPLGIDEKPSLSWILNSHERGQVQTAYQHG
ncbi:hypothetical protein ACFL6U_24405 [Planctomycetota bacterium]